MVEMEAVDTLEAELADVGAGLNQLHARLVRIVSTALGEGLWEGAGLNQLHARLVRIVSTALGEGLREGAGIRSPEHWLALRAGLAPSRAASIVQTARRSSELPAAMVLLDQGALSLDQVVVIAASVPSTYEAAVAELAQEASVTQLRRAVSRYSFEPTDAETPDPGTTPSEAPATLRMSFADGRFDLRYSAPADQGALAEAALAEAKDALFRAGHENVTWADAFADVCSRSVSTVGSSSRRDAFRVYVHLDTGGAWLAGRPSLPRAISDKLTCDGVLQPVWETEGSPVNVGRAQRIVPDRLRRLVEDRDRGCRFPGCVAQAHVEVHHLTHWRDGGGTDEDNLVCLCPHHHDGHHAGTFSMRGDPRRLNGLTFSNSRGLPIRGGPTFTATPGTSPPAPPAPYRGASGEVLRSRLVSFVPSSGHDVEPPAERVA